MFQLKHKFHNYLIEDTFNSIPTKILIVQDRDQLNLFFKGFTINETGRYIIEGDKGITFIRNYIEPTIDNFYIKTKDEILEEYNLRKPAVEEAETNLKNMPVLWPLLSSSKNYLIVTTATCIYIYSFDINFSNGKYNLIYGVDKAYVHTNDEINQYKKQVKMRVRK